MKKAVVALLVFVGSVGLLSAQQSAPTLKLNGFLDTGVKASGLVNRATTLGAYGDYSGAQFGRFDLSGSYANGNNGINFTLRFQGDKTTADTGKTVTVNNVTANTAIPQLKAAYAYTDLFNKLARVQGGFICIDQWTPDDDAANSFVANGGTPGVAVQGSLTAGTNFGVAVLTSPVAGVKLQDSTGTNAVVFGGSYTANSVLHFYGQFKAAQNRSDAIVGVSTSPVSNLFVSTAAYIGYLNDYANYGSTIIDQVAYYKAESWTVGLVAYELLVGANLKGLDKDGKAVSSPLSIKLNPYVDYALDKVTTIELGAVYATYQYSDFAVDLPTGSAPSTDTATLGPKPKVIFQFDPNSKLFLYDLVSFSVGANDKPLGDPDSKVKNTLVAGFQYSF